MNNNDFPGIANPVLRAEARRSARETASGIDPGLSDFHRAQRPQPRTPMESAQSVEELFPGFRQQALLRATDVESAQQKIKDISVARSNALQIITSAGSDKSLSQRSFSEQFMIGAAQALGAPRGYAEQVMDTEEFREEERQLAIELGMATEELIRAEWRLNITLALPMLAIGLNIRTVDDLVVSAPSDSLTPEDRQFAQNLLTEFQAATDISDEQKKEARTKLASQLSDPAGSLSRFLDLDSNAQTVEQMLGILDEASQFTLPEGLTQEDIREALIDAGQDVSEVDEIMLSQIDQGKALQQSFTDTNAYWQAILADTGKLVRGDIASAVQKAKLMNALSQPVITALRPFEYWMEKVVNPIVGLDMWLLEKAMSRTGLMKTDKRWHDTVQGYRREGEGWWSSFGKSWEDADVNGAAKFAIEVLADPLTYVGWGLFAKPFSAGSKIGRIILRAEQVYMKTMDLPWRGLKSVWTSGIGGVKIPQSIARIGIKQGAITVGMTKTLIEDKAGKSIWNVTTAEAGDIIEEAVQEAVTNPQGLGLMTRVGRALLLRHVITEESVRELYRLARVPLQHPITKDLLANINSVVEFTDGQGVGKLLRPNEAADAIARMLELPDTIPVVEWLDSTRDAMVNRALEFGRKDNIKEILTNIATQTEQNFVSAEHSVIANNRIQGGLAASTLQFISQNPLGQAIGVIDRNLSMPFARAYLLFAFYAPFNVLENGMKTAMAGGNPFYRGNPTRRSQVVFNGVDAPMDVVFHEGFVPQTGWVPESSAKFLADGTSGQAAMIEATQDMRNALEKVLTPRWLKNISLFNWGAQVGGAQRSHYWNTQYKKRMQEMMSEYVAAANGVVARNTAGLESVMSARNAEAFRDDLTARVLAGDINLIRAIVNEFTPDEALAGAVAEIFDRFPEIGTHISDFVIQKARTGELFAAGPHGITKLFNETLTEVLYEQFFSSPELYAKRFLDMRDDIIAWEPTNISELNFKMNAIDQSVETFGNVLHTATSASQRIIERIHNPKVKGERYEHFWTTRVAPFLEDSVNTLQDIVTALKAKMYKVEGMTEVQQEQYFRLADNYVAMVAITKKARFDSNAARKDYLVAGGTNYKAPKDRDNAFWDGMRLATGRPWDILEDAYLNATGRISSLKATITGLELPTPIDASTRPLVKENIAHLFGVSPAELGANMYIPEMMALRGRKSFIALVYNRAETAAGGSGLSADELGYTKEAIGTIYDEMMFSIKTRPGGVADDIEPLFQQLGTIRHEIINKGLTKGTLMSDEASGVINGMVDNLAIDMERGVRGLGGERRVEARLLQQMLVREKAVVPRDAKPAVPEVQDWRQGAFSNELRGANKEAYEAGSIGNEFLVDLQVATLDMPMGRTFTDPLISKEAGRRSINTARDALYRRASANANYQEVIHHRLREQYGDTIVVWRGDVGRISGPTPDALSVTPNRRVATRFGGRLPDDTGVFETIPPGRVQGIEINVEDVKVIGNVQEHELIISVDTWRRGLAAQQGKEVIAPGAGQVHAADINIEIAQARVNTAAAEREAYDATPRMNIDELRALGGGAKVDMERIPVRLRTWPGGGQEPRPVETLLPYLRRRVNEAIAEERLMRRVRNKIEAVMRDEDEFSEAEWDLIENEFDEFLKRGSVDEVDWDAFDLLSKDAQVAATGKMRMSDKMRAFLDEHDAEAAGPRQPDWVDAAGNPVDTMPGHFYTRGLSTSAKGGGGIIGRIRRNETYRNWLIRNIEIARASEGRIPTDQIIDSDDLFIDPDKLPQLLQRITDESEDAAASARTFSQQSEQVQHAFDSAEFLAVERGMARETATLTKGLRAKERTLSAAEKQLKGAIREKSNLYGATRPREAVMVKSPYQQKRQEVVDEIRKDFAQDFPDYSSTTVVGDTMRVLYPFWGYETHRWAFWLPREFTRHPGTYTAWGKYQDNTDNGYLSIPGTDLDVNPLRGTIFAGGFRRLTQRDYPEYYDSFAGLSETVDEGARWGFYPGAPYGLFMSMFGAKVGKPQVGEVMPAFYRTVLDIATVIAPEPAGALREAIFNDRFKDFLIATETSANGHEGMDILAKRIAGDKLTPEEEQQWLAGSRRAAIWGPLMEQTGMLRIRPKEKTKVFNAANAIISEMTGIPVPALQDLRKFGLRVEDVFGPLPPDVHRTLNTLEGWSRYTGGSMALQPSELGFDLSVIREFWTTVQNLKDQQLNELEELEAGMQVGTQNMDDWLFMVQTQNRELIAFMDNMKGDPDDPDTGDPRYRGVPMSLQERKDFAMENGMPLIQFHPTEELRDLLFQGEIKTEWDEAVGAFIPNWDKFFMYQAMIEEAAGPDAIAEVRALNSQNKTNLENLFAQVNRDVFRPYASAFDLVLEQMPKDEQSAILKHRRADTPTQREEFAAVPSSQEPGSTAVAVFSKNLREVRNNLREIDPELDAWLLFFKKADKPATQEAADRLIQLRRENGLPN